MQYLLILLVIGVGRCEEGDATYSFEYRVKDEHSGQDFGQEESRSGYNTIGEYEVQLPDGRRQIVRYTVTDPQSGYVVDVSYEGEAEFKDQGPPLTGQSSFSPIRNKPIAPVVVSTRPHSEIDHRPAESVRSEKRFLPRAPVHRPAHKPVHKPEVKPVHNKMIHQYKEVGTTTSGPYPQPAVYIPSYNSVKFPDYKNKMHLGESKILYSLFREDIKDVMIPASGEIKAHKSNDDAEKHS
ncbi:uncharacterized protein LOC111708018 isoform X2 [Eurytemora carolleeae]|uniref:uncharacterized protein LOC111708018 isoform X2 n=1 Tax=Eurytemora carolleeae TaxID=1294199 RepID=UPI000C757436|nr:uncharacterized protein LOC111708018 isoform X2 [Eurytemora carolleeae]|eukprot:XP_023337018.1 uncharacterized protein LOC111708018 isoform X2 [Eurytemora affinis]